MNKYLVCLWMFCCAGSASFAQQDAKVSSASTLVNPTDISSRGTLTKKIYLQNDITPLVKISNIKASEIGQIPMQTPAGNSFEPDVVVTRERKKPVAYITIPAYRNLNGRKEILNSFDLEITEFPGSPSGNGNVVQKPTLVNTSILAGGTWYKIKVPNRGVYKIDFAFLQSLGINPAVINPANIRIYGNGGTVLPEKADTAQPDDLIENAITVRSSGSSFAQGDYILFYANGPQLWEKDSLNKRFIHSNNYYENYSYYFLNYDLGPGKRIPVEAASGTATVTTTTFNDYYADDIDSFNVGSIGKVWWGHRMNAMNSASLNQSFQVRLGSVTGAITVEAYVGNTSDASNNLLRLSFNGALAKSFPLGAQGNSFAAVAAALGSEALNINPGTGDLTVQLSYQPGSGTAVAYVDYLRFNYRRQLSMAGLNQLPFRDWETAGLGAGQNAGFKISGANSNLNVWEITDPLAPIALTGTLSGSDYTVVREGNRLREFVAFDGAQFYTPIAASPAAVPNQNLHGLDATDLLIITTDSLKPAADALADFHRQKDHIVVTVATLNNIYNEFSSGGQDIGGIRNFIKMFYDRAAGEQDRIKNVLLFGAASYDYKNRLSFNTNIVPTFQTYESVISESITGGAYSSDDFYALLDEGDNIDDVGALDIGTGRIPAYNLDEAMKVVEKIKHYASPSSFGPWKNVVSYVSDDKDKGQGGMNHLQDCETVSNFFRVSDRQYNLYKIYADAFPVVNTPSGARYPSVNKAVNDQIYNGTFLMSYSGHGNPDRWAEEAILTADDYGSWTNKDKLPVIVTATCDFGRFDDPGHRSAGARLMINPDGGSIAMITTTQVVYQFQNTEVNKAYTEMQFTPNSDGNWRTLGEALTAAKNATASGAGSNNHKYVVLGDPALKLQMPEYKVRTEQLLMEKDGSSAPTDTIAALGRYKLNGSVTDKNGNILTDFNGEVYVSIFDKTRSVQTTNTRPNVVGVTPSFKLQTNTIAKTRGTVTNGLFSVNFVAPKDINYEYGFGKISYYANSDVTDAAGLDTGYTVGGYNTDADEDNEGPIVQPYIDNDKFRDGGVTGPNPLLYVKLSDDNGINFSGSSIGHDIVAILDDNVQTPLEMNDYYTPLENDYRKGYINFPLYNLPDGKHTIRVKAWDVYNNSGEGVVTFEVKNKSAGFISDLYNYPNPVEDITHIVFQHNQEGEQMDVTLQIFNTAGGLVRTIEKNFKAEGNRTEFIWDGCGYGGYRLAKGVYFYRLTAKTDKGISATAYQKLVLLR